MPEHVLTGPLPAQPRPRAKGMKALLIWNSTWSFRKLVGLKHSGSLNWVASRCADTSRGITKVPWGDVPRLLQKKTPVRSQCKESFVRQQ